MHHRRTLGNTGIQIHAVGLGAMPLSLPGRPSGPEAMGVIHAALDAGVNFIDTADSYCLDQSEMGHNERLIGSALRERGGGSEVLVATKGGIRRPQGAWVHDGRPAYLVEACEASLRRLGTDCLDLYQLHAPDDRVPFEESVGALARLRESGKIRHVGLSNVVASQIDKALAIVPVVSVQNQASPFHIQGLTDGVLHTCQERGLTFIAHSPMGGWRAGRVAHLPVLQQVGTLNRMTPFQVILAWLLARSPALAAIPGASKIPNAVASAEAATRDLPTDDLARLDREFLNL